MSDPKEILKDILKKGVLVSLGTIDDKGVWVTDVLYVCDENFDIYWKSFDHTRHSKAIQKNPQVAGAITISVKANEENVGVQFSGRAEKVDGELPEMSKKHFEKRGSDKKWDMLREGESWYKVTMDHIEVIHEPSYGLEKRVLKKLI